MSFATVRKNSSQALRGKAKSMDASLPPEIRAMGMRAANSNLKGPISAGPGSRPQRAESTRKKAAHDGLPHEPMTSVPWTRQQRGGYSTSTRARRPRRYAGRSCGRRCGATRCVAREWGSHTSREWGSNQLLQIVGQGRQRRGVPARAGGLRGRAARAGAGARRATSKASCTRWNASALPPLSYDLEKLIAAPFPRSVAAPFPRDAPGGSAAPPAGTPGVAPRASRPRRRRVAAALLPRPWHAGHGLMGQPIVSSLLPRRLGSLGSRPGSGADWSFQV